MIFSLTLHKKCSIECRHYLISVWGNSDFCKTTPMPINFPPFCYIPSDHHQEEEYDDDEEEDHNNRKTSTLKKGITSILHPQNNSRGDAIQRFGLELNREDHIDQKEEDEILEDGLSNDNSSNNIENVEQEDKYGESSQLLLSSSSSHEYDLSSPPSKILENLRNDTETFALVWGYESSFIANLYPVCVLSSSWR